MVLDCFIIREYLSDGTVSDNGYYEEAEMLMDLEEFKSGSNKFVVIPCTGFEVQHGLNFNTSVDYGARCRNESVCKKAQARFIPLFVESVEEYLRNKTDENYELMVDGKQICRYYGVPVEELIRLYKKARAEV